MIFFRRAGIRHLSNSFLTSVAVAVIFLLFHTATASSATYSVNYSYDKTGRLTKASYELKKPTAIAYTYDATGNLLRIRFGPSFFWPMFLPALSVNSTEHQVNVPFQRSFK